jgi:ferredoxin-NADP reductase
MSPWLIGTLVTSKMVAENVKSLTFEVPEWPGHKSGQHCDIRLTSETGYQAQRSYSIANSPETGSKKVEFGIQLLDNGEVSPYLWNLTPGDKIEIKGPLGGHFVWSTEMPGPLVLIAGGSGIVPLMAMLREHVNHRENATEAKINVVLLVSARTKEKIPYYEELEKCKKDFLSIKIVYTLTEKAPVDWVGFTRRVDEEILREITAGLLNKMPMTYICGPTGFVEAVANTLVEIGMNPRDIKTERFG